jgi:hypothetical protein
MRLLNQDNDKPLDRLTIYLTQSEAKEMLDSIQTLIKGPEGNHSHIPSEDFQKEITICIYDTDSMSNFNERSKKLIIQDK